MNHSRRKTDVPDMPGVAAPVAHPAVNSLRASQSAVTLPVTSAQIFGGALEVLIDHHGTVYRLKQTALGKRILTK